MFEPMRPDPAEAVRPQSAAEQLAARVAGHAHCPVLLRTLHIGGANLPSRATCDSTVAPAVAHGRPGALGSADMQDAPGASATSCKRKPFGAVISIRSHDCHGNARTCHRRRRSRRTPAAAGGTRASRMHSPRNMQLTCSHAHPNRPAEAALSASRV